MSLENFIKILPIVVVTFLSVYFITPFIIKLAMQINAIDIPRNRHIHNKVMPKLGGLGIFIGFLLGYMLYSEPSAQMNSILIGSFIIIITGIIDDITELKALLKFLGQLVAAMIIAFYGQILLVDIDAFGIYIDFGPFVYPLTIFFIIGCINCINLIDGLDGLASGISCIYFLTIGIIATIQGTFGLDFILVFIMFGSTLGFLMHNFYPAKIFLGDSGSMFLGFIIAIIALLGFKNVTMSSLIIPLLILAIPILDTLFAILRRSLKGESIFKADKFHIHHQFLNKNFSHRTTVIIIYIINILFAIASIIYVLKDRILGYIVYGIILMIVVTFVIRTDVVIEFSKFKKEKKKR